MTADALVAEIDQLLHDKYELQLADLVYALKAMPASRPSVAQLPQPDAALLDAADFTEDAGAYAQATITSATHMALLVTTAVSAAGVATGLGVNASRIRQRRLARTLWAINDNGNWVYPVLQFQSDPMDGPTQQIRGLDQVLPAIPADLHPVAVANLLRTPHPNLAIGGFPRTPLDWLRSGGDVAPVLQVVHAADWAGR